MFLSIQGLFQANESTLVHHFIVGEPTLKGLVSGQANELLPGHTALQGQPNYKAAPSKRHRAVRVCTWPFWLSGEEVASQAYAILKGI